MELTMARSEAQKQADKVYEDKRKSGMTSLRISTEYSEKLGLLAERLSCTKKEALEKAIDSMLV